MVLGAVYPLSFKGSPANDEFLGRVGRIVDIKLVKRGGVVVGARLKVVMGLWQYVPILPAFGFGVTWLPFGDEDNYFPAEVFTPSLDKLYYMFQRGESCPVLIDGDMWGAATFSKEVDLLMMELRNLKRYAHFLYLELRRVNEERAAAIKDVWRATFKEPMEMLRKELEALEKIHQYRRYDYYGYPRYYEEERRRRRIETPPHEEEREVEEREEERPSLVRRIPVIGWFVR